MMRTRFGGPVEGRRSAKSTSQLNYDRCSLKELTKFAADRGLAVTPSSASRSRRHASPLKRDYVKALQQADICRTYQFHDLPPEMKNLIYEELLVLQDSYTCFPQILGTCRQNFKEGSNILYGDNEIGITLLPFRSVVHGKEYEGIENHPATFDWPEWITRVQHLRITFPELRDFYKPVYRARRNESLPTSWFSAVANEILSNLYYFLAPDHRLRSLRLNTLQVSFERIMAEAPTAAYLPRLLGPVVLEYERHREQSIPLDATVPVVTIVNIEPGSTVEQGHSPMWKFRTNAAWTTMINLIDVCRRNLDDNHILAPVTQEIVNEFMKLTKIREIELGDHINDDYMSTIERHAHDIWQKRVLLEELEPIVRRKRLCLGFGHFDQAELSNDTFATAMTDFVKAQIDVAAADAETTRDLVRGHEKHDRPWAFPGDEVLGHEHGWCRA